MDAIISYVIIVLAVFPISLCLYYFTKTGLKEYLFVGMAFIFGILSVYGTLQYRLTSVLLIHQIIAFSYISIYFFFLLYAMRINWERPPKIAYLGILFYIFLIYAIISYQLIEVDDEMQVLLINMNKAANTPSTAGIFQINGIIIVGVGFGFIYELFRIYVFGLILYMYLTTDLPLKTTKTMNLWRIWIIAVSGHILGSLLEVGNSLDFWDIQVVIINVLLLFTLILVGYIVVWHPEAFLITHTQLIRAIALYENTPQWEKENHTLKFGLSSIMEYIKSIPIDSKTLVKEE